MEVMDAQAALDPVGWQRMRQEKRLYHDFLRLNYRIFDRYVQIQKIFAVSIARTHAERVREQEQLEEVNAVLHRISTMILSLEKNSEDLLFTD
ncbi:unnamed protein product [Caenorhabditis sp. 36 PRJEB53466]|nr:unnamed protein product [Caenorhabditis sp. 36 PRJEB53466]